MSTRKAKATYSSHRKGPFSNDPLQESLNISTLSAWICPCFMSTRKNNWIISLWLLIKHAIKAANPNALPRHFPALLTDILKQGLLMLFCSHYCLEVRNLQNVKTDLWKNSTKKQKTSNRGLFYLFRLAMRAKFQVTLVTRCLACTYGLASWWERNKSVGSTPACWQWLCSLMKGNYFGA